MIMLHPDHRGGAYLQFRRTGRFTTLPERPCDFDLSSKPQDAVTSKSHRTVAIDRAPLLGHSALILLFIVAIVLRSLW